MKKRNILFLSAILIIVLLFFFQILKSKKQTIRSYRTDEKFVFEKGSEKDFLKIEADYMETDSKGKLYLEGNSKIVRKKDKKKTTISSDKIIVNPAFTKFVLTGNVFFNSGDTKISGDEFIYRPGISLKSERNILFESKDVKFKAKSFLYDIKKDIISFKTVKDFNSSYQYKCKSSGFDAIRYNGGKKLLFVLNEKKNSLFCENSKKIFSFKRAFIYLSNKSELSKVKFFEFDYEIISPKEKLFEKIVYAKGNCKETLFFIKNRVLKDVLMNECKSIVKTKKRSTYKTIFKIGDFLKNGNNSEFNVKKDLKVFSLKNSTELPMVEAEKAKFVLTKNKNGELELFYSRLTSKNSTSFYKRDNLTLSANDIETKGKKTSLKKNAQLLKEKEFNLKAERITIVNEKILASDKVEGKFWGKNFIARFQGEKVLISKNQIVIEENGILNTEEFVVLGKKLVLMKNSHNIKVYGGTMRGKGIVASGEKIEKTEKKLTLNGASKLKVKDISLSGEKIIVFLGKKEAKKILGEENISISTEKGKGNSDKVELKFGKKTILFLSGHAQFSTTKGDILKGDKLTLELSDDNISN